MISWVAIVSGLALLCPAEVLLGSRVEVREFESFRTLENSPRRHPWWWVPALWIDPLRAALGAWLLASELQIAALARTAPTSAVYWLFVGVLGLATLLQTLAKRSREATLAPIGFLIGIAFALTPWAVASIGVTMAAVGLFALRRFSGFFIAGGMGILAIGLALRSQPFLLLPAVGLFAIPVLVAAMTGRPLELPARIESRDARPRR